jgi:hypothetical protein
MELSTVRQAYSFTQWGCLNPFELNVLCCKSVSLVIKILNIRSWPNSIQYDFDFYFIFCSPKLLSRRIPLRLERVSFKKISFVKISFDKIYFVKISFKKISFEKISFEKISFEKISFEKISFEKISFEKISFVKISFEKFFFEKISFSR